MATPSRPVTALPENTAPADGAPPGALIGYAYVSGTGQNLDRQIRVLSEAGCIRVFADRQPGKTAARPELETCLDHLRPGDILVVASLDRLSRSLHELITLIAGLRRRELGFRSLHEALDTTTSGGRLVFHVFAALAEFIRELIVQGTHEGIAAARARGVRLGRPPAMTPEQIQHARALLAQPDNTVSSIARLLGVSRATIYKYVPELAGGSSDIPHRAGLSMSRLSGEDGLGASRSNTRPQADARPAVPGSGKVGRDCAGGVAVPTQNGARHHLGRDGGQSVVVNHRAMHLPSRQRLRACAPVPGR
jgi:DNA invertase Pin-like site-specific DNA recombinase